VSRRAWIAAALAALALLPSAAVAAEPQTSLADIEDEVMCTICGTTLQLANAPQAQQERDLINQLIAEGKSKEEIKDALVVEYGPEVLAVPSSEGFDLAAWIVPIVGILIALVAIVLAARRWRSEKPSSPSPDSPASPSATESERLQADLSRYDP
jgi:cytochrome c-type biogenesis protein CcmH/NrfF